MRLAKRALYFVQALDSELSGRQEEVWKELLSYVDFSRVGKLQHGLCLGTGCVLQDNDRVFAGSRLFAKKKPEAEKNASI